MPLSQQSPKELPARIDHRNCGCGLKKKAFAFALASLWCVAGCNFGNELEVVRNTCESDEDCVSGRCDEELLFCVRDDEAPQAVILEVSTPGDASLGEAPLVFAFEPRDYPNNEKVDISLPDFATLVGTVRSDYSAFSGTVPAKITLQRTSNLSRKSFVVETTTLPEPQTFPGASDPVDFALSVPPGPGYELLVEPTGDAAAELPPLRFSEVALEEPGSTLVQPIQYTSELAQLRGTLVQLIDGAEEPIDGLQVDIVDKEKLQTVSTRSETGEGSLEEGAFALVYDPPETAGFFVRVRGGEDEVFPTVLVDADFLSPGTAGQVTIQVPVLPEVNVEIDLELPEGAPPLEDLVGSPVTFRSISIFDDDTGLSGSYVVQSEVESDGKVRATLVAGTYEVLVSPLAELGLNVAIGELDTILAAATITLVTQPTVEGALRTFDGRPGFGVPISALALGAQAEMSSEDETQSNRTQESATDSDGNFRLQLDRGGYDLEFRPGSSSGFPWTVSEDLFIDGGALRTDDLELALPWAVQGRLQNAGGTPIRDAEIRAFRIVEKDGSVRNLEIASAFTDEEGGFVLLLP